MMGHYVITHSLLCLYGQGGFHHVDYSVAFWVFILMFLVRILIPR